MAKKNRDPIEQVFTHEEARDFAMACLTGDMSRGFEWMAALVVQLLDERPEDQRDVLVIPARNLRAVAQSEHYQRKAAENAV